MPVLKRMTLPGFESSWMQALKTVTENEQVAVLPAASVAVQVMDVVPRGSGEPDGGTQAVVTPGQLSEAVGGGKLTTEEAAGGQAGADDNQAAAPQAPLRRRGLSSSAVTARVRESARTVRKKGDEEGQEEEGADLL